MELITVYLKRGFSTDGKRIVIAYSDKECTELKAVFQKDIVPLPNKRRKAITLNCVKYNIQWL